MITNFYVDPENVQKDSLKMVGEEAQHILKVLRYRKGDEIWVVDGCGTRYKVIIEETSSDLLKGRILSFVHMENEPTCQVTLAQAICRKDRMDFLIEKATEIGVHSIIPVVTERTLIKIDKISNKKNRIDRWKRLAIASMKQSLRTVLPEIQNVIKFQQLISKFPSYDLSLIATLDDDAKSIKECEELKKGARRVLLVVGPEAGFTEKELSLAKAQGAIPITLGSRRLRTETAGMVFLSLTLHQLNELG